MGTQGPPPAAGARFEPTWKRIAGSTAVLFLVILAFLVGRVRAGADPGLRTTGSTTPAQLAPNRIVPPASDPQSGSGADPQDGSDPFAPPEDHGSGGQDNFGNAVPDGNGTQGLDDGSGAQGLQPPSTHVS
jgi:hypothetical protein